MIEINVARVILIWMSTTIFTLFTMNGYYVHFTFGPNDSLHILGISINTTVKYGLIVSFSFINSGIRVIFHNILQPYMILVVQNKDDIHVNAKEFYELSIISTMYTWFDYILYINILLSQIDLILFELVSDLIMTCIVTNYYIRHKENLYLNNLSINM